MKVKEALALCRHRPEITGKDLRIAIHEFSISARVRELIGGDPRTVFLDTEDLSHRYDATRKLHGNVEKLVDAHTYMTWRMIRDILPEAMLYITTADHAGIKAAQAIHPHLANFSTTGAYASVSTIKDYGKGTFIMWAAGNDAEEGENAVNRFDDHVTTVYGWKVRIRNGQPEYERASYSSFGNGWGDIAGLTELVMSDGTPYPGTSAACPYAVGLVGQYLQHHTDTFGYSPAIKTIRDFIERNGHDVGPAGWDFESGYGLLKLPAEFELQEIMLIPSKQTVRRRKYREGLLVKETEEPAYVPPYINDGRMRVAIRDVELLGLTAYWDGSKKQVHIAR